MDPILAHLEKVAPDLKAKYVWNTPKKANLQMAMTIKKKVNTLILKK